MVSQQPSEGGVSQREEGSAVLSDTDGLGQVGTKDRPLDLMAVWGD